MSLAPQQQVQQGNTLTLAQAWPDGPWPLVQAPRPQLLAVCPQ